jgi:hypothetical protein
LVMSKKIETMDMETGFIEEEVGKLIKGKWISNKS